MSRVENYKLSSLARVRFCSCFTKQVRPVCSMLGSCSLCNKYLHLYFCVLFAVSPRSYSFLRLQINVLGGYLYLQNSGTASMRRPLSTEVQKVYLEQSHYLMRDGLATLTIELRAHVNRVLGGASLTGTYSPQSLAQVGARLRMIHFVSLCSSLFTRVRNPQPAHNPALLQLLTLQPVNDPLPFAAVYGHSLRYAVRHWLCVLDLPAPPRLWR